MMNRGNRTIKVDKNELIETLKKHKVKHIEDYDKAVKAYKIESIKQLKNLIEKAENNELDLRLQLTEPVDNSSNYDSIISMFEWEVKDEVELTQDEFKEYVLNENSYSQHAFTSNSMYLGNLD